MAACLNAAYLPEFSLSLSLFGALYYSSVLARFVAHAARLFSGACVERWARRKRSGRNDGGEPALDHRAGSASIGGERYRDVTAEAENERRVAPRLTADYGRHDAIYAACLSFSPPHPPFFFPPPWSALAVWVVKHILAPASGGPHSA